MDYSKKRKCNDFPNHWATLFLCFLLWLLLGVAPSYAQSFEGGWRVTGSFALQEQDRRMFGQNERLAARIMEWEEQVLSYDIALGLHRSILHREDFRLDLGVGYRHEFNTFGRTYSIPFFTGRYIEPLDIVKRYQVHQLIVPLTLHCRLIQFGKSGILFLGGSIEGSLSFGKSISGMNFKSNNFKLTVAPYSLEVNPGIGVKVGSWSGMVNYRAYHQRQIDEAIFFSALFPPWLYDEVPTGYETYNPFKMWITVSRDLEDGWWKRKGKR